MPRTARDRYDSLFQWYGHESAVDWQLLKAQAICESDLDPDIPGATGDLGLAQFTDPTWQEVTARWERQTPQGTERLIDRRNPEAAIRAQAVYLAALLARTHGDPALALAAYNWGIGRVRRTFLTRQRPYVAADVPVVTQHYVARVLQTWTAVRVAESG